jgi:hypothetical protein
MPPPSKISDYDPRFFRPCIFPMLRRLGYGTRVTINNGVGPDQPAATEFTISLSAFDQSGKHLGISPEITRLQPGEIEKLDVDSLLDEHFGLHPDEDVLCILHPVPARFEGQTSVEVDPKELMAHVFVSDDFIEYHQREGGIVTGVAYQTGLLNDPRSSSTRTTVCQAPKVIVSEPVDTMFALMNVSNRFEYANPVTMNFWILGPQGNRVARSAVEVPPFSYRLVSTTDVLAEAGVLEQYREDGGMGMFLGYSKNGTLVPLSLTRNKVSGAIACDHTLPPVFYVTTWGGEKRLQANARLEREFFAEALAPAPVPVAAR